ncbi:hypothetical protein [Streptomyces sp. NPDC052179]|uniref:hypothetical protein n=1 Tax=Streptomyces sp. NPDC052179 TaxID=3155680 RepID=UPI003425D87E
MPTTPAPEPIPVQHRPDDTAADTGSLVDMGVVEEQPEPPAPEEPPVEEPPADEPGS